MVWRFPLFKALTILIIFTLVLSACTQQPAAVQPAGSTPAADSPTAPAVENTNPPSGQATALPQTAPAKPAEGSKSGGTVITFAAYSFMEEVYKKAIAEFQQQHPEITIQVKEMPPSLDTRLIASTADTAVLLFRPQSGESSFLDLSKYALEDPSFQPESFWPGILQACQDGEGRTFGLPIYTEPTGIYYQEKTFQAANLKLPGPGWTWEELQKDITALTRTEKGQPVYGFADDSFMDTPDETLLSPRISFLLGQTSGKIDAGTFEKELRWYLNLVNTGSLYAGSIYPQKAPGLGAMDQDKEAWSKAWNATWSTVHEMYVNHPPAMWKGRLDQMYWGDADIKAMPDGSITMTGSSGPIIQSKPDIGWAPFPVSADGKDDHTTPNVVTCAVISAGSQNPRAAWTWLNYLASHPILPDWSLAIPSKPSGAESIKYWTKIPEKLRDSVRYAAEHGWYSNPYPDAVLSVNQALLKAVAEKADLRAALAEAGGQVETAVQPTPNTSPVAVAAPEATAAPGETTIEFYTPLFFGDERYKALVAAFHKLHPDINVNFNRDSAVQGATGLAGAFDCFAWLPEKGLPTDQLYDLNQFLLTDKLDVASEFLPDALDEFSQDGKPYALPTVYRPNLIFYNADLLAQRGLNPPAKNWTYADFMKLISAAAVNDPSKPVYGFALEYPTADIDMLLAGRNLSLMDTGGDGLPAFRFDTPETRDTVQWLADQVKAAVIYPVTPLQMGTHPDNYMDARKLILDGRVAFWMSWFDKGNGGRFNLQDAKFTIGVAAIPLPKGADGWRPYHMAMGQYISRRAKNPAACWTWIKYLSEQPDSTYGIPARRSVRESPAWTDQVGAANARIYQAALEQRRTYVQANRYGLGAVREWWDSMLAEVMFGADPLPLLHELQGKADAFSACLAGSSDYKAGLKSQAQGDCADKVNPK